MDKRDTSPRARWHGLLTEDHKTRRMILHLDSLAIDEEDRLHLHEWASVIPSTDNSARLDADRVAIPARFEVCNICEGSGSHVNPKSGEWTVENRCNGTLNSVFTAKRRFTDFEYLDW